LVSDITGAQTTYKVAGDWVLVNSWKFSACYNWVVSAPTWGASQSIGLWSGNDSCASRTYRAGECVNTDGSANQFCIVKSNPANKDNSETGDNSGLALEVADIYTFGVVDQTGGEIASWLIIRQYKMIKW